MTRLLLALLLAATTAAAAAEPAPRFFVAGDGTLALVGTLGGTVRVTYRRPDGSYDPAALAQIRRALRSKAGAAGPVEPRLVELLARVQAMTGRRPLTVVSGYRSPTYNAGLRSSGHKVASASLHTEGLAADVALPRAVLAPTWQRVRDLDCCGAGMYSAQGFLHVDVGPSRFWEAATSRVDENLSAGNARLFGRTDFDRYAAGDAIVVALHFLTTPPVGIARTARLVPDGGGAPVEVRVDAPGDDACIEADATTRLRVPAAPPVGPARLVLATCDPRPERTPAEVPVNAVDVR
jgi:uncharacterized protein YcbK (DUF882 family)